MYHHGNRDLQATFGSTALADRLVQHTRRSEFDDNDIEFIEKLPFFFLATANPEGRPDCSFKGGKPGFVRIIDPKCLIFPDYDGNGMFKSLGNILANSHVGMLFINMDNHPKRLRVNGKAELDLESPLIGEFEGAQGIVRVTPDDIFPNCPRYIPDVKSGNLSKYLPNDDKPPLEPAWKAYEQFEDVVPDRKR